MTIEQYAELQRIIESQEKAKSTGKLIIFIENGVVKAVEVTNKVKIAGIVVLGA